MAKIIVKYSKITLVTGLIIALVMIHFSTPAAEATTLESREVKISDSRTSQTGVDYDFEANGSTTANIKCIKVQFCTTATGSCTGPTGISFSEVDKGASTSWNGIVYDHWEIIASTTSQITATSTNGSQNFGTDGSFIFGNITNPSSAAAYYARIYTYTNQDCSTGQVDDGVVAFAIIDEITVTATVAESLTFTVGAVASTSCDNDSGSPTYIDTTTTTVPFGELAVDAFKVACHTLTCNTNASSGYSLTGQEDDQLIDDSTAQTIDDTTCDNDSCTESSFDTWATASNNYGFGHSCENVTGVPCGSSYDFGGTPNYRQFASIGDSETPQAIMSASTATSTAAKIHYKIVIGVNQAAGSYSNKIVYIATPTY
jgi:hypothetical protein